MCMLALLRLDPVHTQPSARHHLALLTPQGDIQNHLGRIFADGGDKVVVRDVCRWHVLKPHCRPYAGGGGVLAGCLGVGVSASMRVEMALLQE